MEDSKEVKTNTELYDMYHSPVKKKAKLTNIEDDDLQRFMFASKEEIQGKLVVSRNSINKGSCKWNKCKMMKYIYKYLVGVFYRGHVNTFPTRKITDIIL